MTSALPRRSFLSLAGAAALVAGPANAQPRQAHAVPPPSFASQKVRVNGTTLHVVRGGRGPALVLVHGFPEDWSEFRSIMPQLARQFDVVAIDLPGIGRSAPAVGGYDAANLAAHLRALVQALDLKQPFVVGHDLGGIVSYAYVRRHADATRGVMILDVPIPGIKGWDEAVADFWHIGFIQAPGQLAEKLVTGRQDVFIDHLLSIANFTPARRAYYAAVYGAPQLHAAFEIYRGFPTNAQDNARATTPTEVPLVVAAGEKSFFAPLLPTFIEGLRAMGVRRVEGAAIADASHYVVADNPVRVADLIARQARHERQG